MPPQKEVAQSRDIYASYLTLSRGSVAVLSSWLIFAAAAAAASDSAVVAIRYGRRRPSGLSASNERIYQQIMSGYTKIIGEYITLHRIIQLGLKTSWLRAKELVGIKLRK